MILYRLRNDYSFKDFKSKLTNYAYLILSLLSVSLNPYAIGNAEYSKFMWKQLYLYAVIIYS